MNKKGLTIIELLITVIILSIIMTSAIALHLHNQRLYSRENSLIDIRANVRGAMDIVLDDLRLAGFNPEEAFPPAFDPGITTADKRLVWIRADFDTDGVYDDGEEIGYGILGTELFKYVNMGSGSVDTSLIAKNIDYLEFVYVNAGAVEFTRPVSASYLDSIIAIKVIIVGATAKQFLNNSSVGTYRDGTSYNDRKYRCWDSTYVRLRNM